MNFQHICICMCFKAKKTLKCSSVSSPITKKILTDCRFNEMVPFFLFQCLFCFTFEKLLSLLCVGRNFTLALNDNTIYGV